MSLPILHCLSISLSQRFDGKFSKPPATNRIRAHRLFCSTMQKCIRFSLHFPPLQLSPSFHFHKQRKRWIRSGRKEVVCDNRCKSQKMILAHTENERVIAIKLKVFILTLCCQRFFILILLNFQTLSKNLFLHKLLMILYEQIYIDILFYLWCFAIY